jgi:hypothetical protein
VKGWEAPTLLGPLERAIYSCLSRTSQIIEVRYSWIFFVVSWGGVRLSLLGTSTTNWPIVPALDDRWWWMWSSRWNENWQGKQKYSEKTCPSATMSTINPTWPNLGSNPGRRCGKPATNRLSYGAAYFWLSLFLTTSCWHLNGKSLQLWAPHLGGVYLFHCDKHLYCIITRLSLNAQAENQNISGKTSMFRSILRY